MNGRTLPLPKRRSAGAPGFARAARFVRLLARHAAGHRSAGAPGFARAALRAAHFRYGAGRCTPGRATG